MLDPSEVRPLVESARADIRDSIALSGHSLAAYTEALRGRDLSLESLGEAIVREPGPQGRRIACRNACSHCCHQLVVTTPLEVLRIAERIRTRWPEDRKAGLIERLKRIAAVPATRDARTTRRHPCPLLENRLCSVYDVRPGPCRSLYSYSEIACRRGLEKSTRRAGDTGRVPSPDLPIFVGMALALGLEAGQIEMGLDTEPVDLVRGLLIALENRDAAELWLEGGTPFGSARVETPLSSREMIASLFSGCSMTTGAPGAPAG